MPTGFLLKIIGNLALVLITIVMGLILHKSGKPYNTIIFSIHKLATIAFLIFIVVIVVNHIRINGSDGIFITFLIASIISVFALMISGGLMSLDRMQGIMMIVHWISTFIFLICISGLFYRIIINPNSCNRICSIA